MSTYNISTCSSSTGSTERHWHSCIIHENSSCCHTYVTFFVWAPVLCWHAMWKKRHNYLSLQSNACVCRIGIVVHSLWHRFAYSDSDIYGTVLSDTLCYVSYVVIALRPDNRRVHIWIKQAYETRSANVDLLTSSMCGARAKRSILHLFYFVCRVHAERGRL